jgi:peptidoglycan hydrolase-like protein with peptidoglycan-binding domain
MVDELFLDEQVQEPLRVVQIEGHPDHGTFEVEVPESMNEKGVMDYVNNGIDLDAELGLPKGTEAATTDVSFITQHENPANVGLRNEKWHMFSSSTGTGEKNLGGGSVKLTPEEIASGIVQIGGEAVDFTQGITQEQSNALTQERVDFAQRIALASLNKAGMQADAGKVTALTSLIYNVGAGAWAGSKAKKFLEAGNMEDFMHEAFSEEAGWVNIKGVKSKGLIRRRATEGELFTRTQVDTADNSGGFSFISSAQAHEIENPPENDLVDEVSRARQVLEGISPSRKPAQGADLGPRFDDPIKLAQSVLGLTVDGINGPKTKAAVKAFQEDEGLEKDGVVGPKTLKALRGITPGRKPEFAKPEEVDKVSKSFLESFTEVKPALWGVPMPASFKTYANHVIGFTGIMDETTLKTPEKQFLISTVVPALKAGQGKTGLSYTGKNPKNIPFGPEGAKGIGYFADINFSPEIRETIKLTLGKADIVRHGNSVMIVNEYDMPMKAKVLAREGFTEAQLRGDGSALGTLKSLPDRFKYIMNATGDQGKAHRFAELFSAQEGESLSHRYNLGTLEELGLTEDNVKHLQSLEDYEVGKINAGKMNPDNVMTPNAN